MFKISFEDAGVIGIVGGILAAGWAFIQTKRMKDTANKLSMSLEDVSKKTPIDIQKAFLDAAVEKAVNKKVDDWSKSAAASLKTQIRSDMDQKIHSDVDAVYQELRTKVDDKIDQEVEKINIDSAEVTRDVKEKVQAKLFREIVNASGITKVFGVNSDDFDGLRKVLEMIPIEKRANFLNNYYWGR